MHFSLIYRPLFKLGALGFSAILKSLKTNTFATLKAFLLEINSKQTKVYIYGKNCKRMICIFKKSLYSLNGPYIYIYIYMYIYVRSNILNINQKNLIGMPHKLRGWHNRISTCFLIRQDAILPQRKSRVSCVWGMLDTHNV